ncbi:YlxR family protein [Nocardioides ungokensis]|nr:YlxR family protein [Nocardioides ungokensis]
MVREHVSAPCPDPDLASVPVRTCIGCRRRTTKRELLRVTVGSDANGHPAVVPDPAGSAPGRGAHLHPTTGCYDLAVRRKAFTRALRARNGLSSAPVGDYLDSRAVQP